MGMIVDPTMRECMLAYLREASVKDPALNEKFDPSRIDKCCESVIEKVMDSYVKHNGRRDGGCFCHPEEIYKMARDFFIDGESAAETPRVGNDVDQADEPCEASEEPAETPRKRKLGELEQLDFFGGSDD